MKVDYLTRLCLCSRTATSAATTNAATTNAATTSTNNAAATGATAAFHGQRPSPRRNGARLYISDAAGEWAGVGFGGASRRICRYGSSGPSPVGGDFGWWRRCAWAVDRHHASAATATAADKWLQIWQFL